MPSRQPPGDLGHVLPFVKLTRLKLAEIQKASREHEQNDDARFRELQGDKGIAGIHHALGHITNMLTVIQDAQIEGFRRINERMDSIERRAKNGR
jgi:hypothetical protein